MIYSGLGVFLNLEQAMPVLCRPGGSVAQRREKRCRGAPGVGDCSRTSDRAQVGWRTLGLVSPNLHLPSPSLPGRGDH